MHFIAPQSQEHVNTEKLVHSPRNTSDVITEVRNYVAILYVSMPSVVAETWNEKAIRC